jgi:hypothetical protein
VSGVALDWLSYYLVDREQFVRLGATSSHCRAYRRVLLLIMYTIDLVNVILSNHLLPHLYADDKQLYGSSRPGVWFGFFTALQHKKGH